MYLRVHVGVYDMSDPTVSPSQYAYHRDFTNGTDCYQYCQSVGGWNTPDELHELIRVEIIAA
jgi:hypothetical protein